MKAPPPGTQSISPVATLKHFRRRPEGAGRRFAAGQIDQHRGLQAGPRIAVIGLRRILRQEFGVRAQPVRDANDALVVDKRGRGEGRLVDAGDDREVDMALVDFAGAVEIVERQAKIGERAGIVRGGRGACRGCRQSAADRIGAVAGGVDRLDPQPGRQLVLEGQPDAGQFRGQGGIGESAGEALDAEAQMILDIVAVQLPAGLLEEQQDDFGIAMRR